MAHRRWRKRVLDSPALVALMQLTSGCSFSSSRSLGRSVGRSDFGSGIDPTTVRKRSENDNVWSGKRRFVSYVIRSSVSLEVGKETYSDLRANPRFES